MSTTLPPRDLFVGLPEQAVAKILGRMSRRRLDTDQYLCRQGEPGDSLFLIVEGLVEVWLERDGDRELIARLRPGDAVGEMSLFTGEARAASVVAAVPTEVLELDARTCAEVVAEHPGVLRNVAMMLVERQKRTNKQFLLRRERGEAVALVVGEDSADLADHGVVAAGRAVRRGVALIDMTAEVRHARATVAAEHAADVLAALDNLLSAERTVIVMVDHRHPELGLLLRHLDRVVCLLSAAEARQLERRIAPAPVAAEWIATGSHEPVAGDGWTPLRTISTGARDRRWLGRHLARTKLGLALGAGGAKGFAHVGVLGVLEDAGYEVDVVTGSSIGAIAATCIAMGMDTTQVRDTLSHLLSREVCGSYFRLVTDSGQDGPQLFYDALSALAGDAACDGLARPLGILTADLNAQLPHAFTDGPLAPALHAALAIPGLASPYLQGERRLIDGVAISPVPVQLARQLGADITIAVNLMSRIVLDRWPDAGQSGATPAKPRPSRMDPVIETFIMLQTDTSVRNGDEADVTITPGFARSSWRDIHLGEKFEQAGRTAALAQLDALKALVQPSRG